MHKAFNYKINNKLLIDAGIIITESNWLISSAVCEYEYQFVISVSVMWTNILYVANKLRENSYFDNDY